MHIFEDDLAAENEDTPELRAKVNYWFNRLSKDRTMLDLAAVIAQVESENDPYRLRFEPELYARFSATVTPTRWTIIKEIIARNHCSAHTAVMIACTSWGKYQILGENLYQPGANELRTSIGLYLAADQDSSFRDFVRSRQIDFPLKDIQTDPAIRQKFIVAYNGPGAVDAYWTAMQAAIKTFGGTVDVST